MASLEKPVAGVEVIHADGVRPAPEPGRAGRAQLTVIEKVALVGILDAVARQEAKIRKERELLSRIRAELHQVWTTIVENHALDPAVPVEQYVLTREGVLELPGWKPEEEEQEEKP